MTKRAAPDEDLTTPAAQSWPSCLHTFLCRLPEARSRFGFALVESPLLGALRAVFVCRMAL